MSDNYNGHAMADEIIKLRDQLEEARSKAGEWCQLAVERGKQLGEAREFYGPAGLKTVASLIAERNEAQFKLAIATEALQYVGRVCARESADEPCTCIPHAALAKMNGPVSPVPDTSTLEAANNRLSERVRVLGECLQLKGQAVRLAQDACKGD